MTAPAHPHPRPDFAEKPLALRAVSLTGYKRIFWTGGDPLEFRPGTGRFNAPSREFRVLYGADTLACCLAETLIRDRSALLGGPAPITVEDLDLRSVVELESLEPVAVVDLTGPGALRAGIPSAVAKAPDYGLSQAWSLAFWKHPSAPEGVLYRSRLDDDYLCVALYDRAAAKIRAADTTPLIRHPNCDAALERYRIQIVP